MWLSTYVEGSFKAILQIEDSEETINWVRFLHFTEAGKILTPVDCSKLCTYQTTKEAV